MAPTHGPGLRGFKSIVPVYGQPSQRQTITVPCRKYIPIRFGELETNITISRMCESGIVSDVYGYDQTTLFSQMKANFENFYVLGVTVDWCPSNLRGVTMDLN